MLEDNSGQLTLMMTYNKTKALVAVGKAAVEVIQDYMMNNYSTVHYHSHSKNSDSRIYDTGTLMRSISSQVDFGTDTVAVGTNIEYASWVHNGTRKVEARPFIKDAVMDNVNMFNEIFAEYLAEGMK